MTMLALIDGQLAWRVTQTLLVVSVIGALLLPVIWAGNRVLSQAAARVRHAWNYAALVLLGIALPAAFVLIGPTVIDPPKSLNAPVSSHVGLIEIAVEREPERPNITARETPSVAFPTPQKVAPASLSQVPMPTTRFLAWVRQASPMVAALYFAGVLVMIVRLFTAVVRSQALVRGSRRIADSQLRLLFDRQCERFGLRVKPALAWCDEIAMPLVIGFLRPAVLLPPSMTAGLTPEQSSDVIAHELAHIRRLDPLLVIVQRLIESLLFFHPIVWYLSRCIQRERELCCDELVVNAGGDRLRYAQTLLRVAELRLAACDELRELTALAADGRNTSELRRRIARLLGTPANASVAPTRSGVVALVLGMLLLGALGVWTTDRADAARKADAPTATETTGRDTREPAATEPIAAEDLIADLRSDRGNAEGALKAGESADAVNVLCVDADGQPVAGVEVYVFQHVGGDPGRYEQSGPFTTDAQGHVSGVIPIVRNEEGHFDRHFYARVPGTLVGVGRSLKAKYHSISNPEGRIEMRPSRTVEGYVKVPTGVEPSKLTVHAHAMYVKTGDGDFDFQLWMPEGFSGIDTALPEIFERRPTADGKFQFTDMPTRGRLTVLLREDGYGEAQSSNSQTLTFDKPIDLVLVPEGVLAGRVSSPEGTPVQGVEVAARRDDGASYSSTTRAMTDGNGEFKLRGLAASRYNVTIRDPERRWVTRPQEQVAVSSGKTESLTLKMEAHVVITGRAIDEAGAPVAGAAISALTDTNDDVGLDSDVTGDGGRYELRLPSGRAQFYFNGLPDGFAYPDPQVIQKLDIKAGQAPIDIGDYVLKRKTATVSATIDADDAQAAGAPADEPKPGAPAVSSIPTTKLTGVVVGEDGQPVADVRLESQFHSEGQRTRATATSDALGRFTITIGKERVNGLPVYGTSADGRLAIAQLPWEFDVGQQPDLQLTLKPAQAVRVEVVGGDRPVVGATSTFVLNWTHVITTKTDNAGIANFLLPVDAEVHSLHAWRDGLGLDYKAYFSVDRLRAKQPQVRPDLSQPVRLALTGVKPLTVTLLDAATEQPVPDTITYVWLVKKPGESDDLNLSGFVDQFGVRTDANGRATFNWLPQWESSSVLQVWANSDDYDRQRGMYKSADGSGALTMRLNRLVPLSGRVALPDGSPAAGIRLQVSGDGYTHDSFREHTTTGPDGRYVINVSPNQAYIVVVEDREWAAPPATEFVILPGQPRNDVDFALQPATRVHGRVTLGNEQQPVPGQEIHIQQLGAELSTITESGLPAPAGDRRAVRPQASDFATTDADGRFQFFVGPGRFHLGSSSDQLQPRQFTVTTETELEFSFQMDRPAEAPLSGLVVTGTPSRPVSNATVDCIDTEGRSRRLTVTTDADGRFEMTRQPFAATLHAQSEDGSALGVFAIGPDDQSATITIQPMAAARGRLIDGDTNAPLANAELEFKLDLGSVTYYDGDGSIRFGGRVTTDQKGDFTLQPLAAGGDYQLRRVIDRNTEGRTNRSQQLKVLRAEAAGEVLDLGDVVVEPDPDRQVRKDRIHQAFDKPDVAVTRHQNGLRDIRIGHLRLLLIFADPDNDLARQFFQLRFEDEQVRSATDDYRLVPLPLTGEKADDTFAFASALGIDASDAAAPVFVVIDEQEQRLATVEAAELSTDGAIDKQKVLDFLAAYVPEQLDAQVLFDDALTRANAENKRVFIQESATWCGPCWILSRRIATYWSRITSS